MDCHKVCGEPVGVEVDACALNRAVEAWRAVRQADREALAKLTVAWMPNGGPGVQRAAKAAAALLRAAGGHNG